MYPPPQGEVSTIETSTRIQEHGVRFGFGPLPKHELRSLPFSYEYILEDGKMPILAEFHPVQKKKPGIDLKQSQHSSSRKQFQLHPSMQTVDQSHRQERQSLHYNIAVGTESTAEKLKRALSLSSGRNSSQPSRNPSSASRSDAKPHSSLQPSRHVSTSSRHGTVASSPRSSHITHPAPPPESRVPSLILPTPTPSPEPFHSASSSPRKSSPHYGFPLQTNQNARFSWSSCDDDDDYTDDDFEFMRDGGFGHLSHKPKPPVSIRKNKAFELLGISTKGMGPPRSTGPSAAVSLRPSNPSSNGDYYSRNTSRRPSSDLRRSMNSQKSHASDVKPYQRAITPTTSLSDDDEETPRPIRHVLYQAPLSRPKPPDFTGKPTSTALRPEPIIIPDFPCPPALEIRSAPIMSVSKAESPLQMPQSQSLELVAPRPLPPMVAKASRFIEHLDANANRLSLPLRKSPRIPHVIFADNRTTTDPDMIAPVPRRATSPLPAPMRALPAPAPRVSRVVMTQSRASSDMDPVAVDDVMSSGVRRSVSMRESTSGPWGAVLCTAQARPIVATGHARMV